MFVYTHPYVFKVNTLSLLTCDLWTFSQFANLIKIQLVDTKSLEKYNERKILKP